MADAQIDEPTRSRPLRLWPGVAAVALQWLAWLVAPSVLPAGIGGYAMALGLLAGALAVVVWWAFFSRAPTLERWGALALIVIALAATPRLLHPSVAAGNMGLQFFLYAVPTVCLAFVVSVVVGSRLAVGPRRVAMVVAILLACGMWTLVRSKGLTGDGFPEFAWRWSQTAEEHLLTRVGAEPAAAASAPASAEPAATTAGWPGFRGPDRDGVIPGVRIGTDWSRSPPVELWRRPIGPAVSSFAIGGDLLYTQEQRGDDEIVACYQAATGEPVWIHRDAVRFSDAHVGAGPRATPALSDGSVYTLGATGILNALDAGSGAVVWSRDAAADTGAKRPLWGFVASPLVVGDVVVVHTNRLVAYDLATGDRRWLGPAGSGSYSSPQLLTIDGVPQILLLTHAGLTSVAPADGNLLWEHPMPGIGIVQPALASRGDVLISEVDGGAAPVGTHRIAVAREPGGWTTEERWKSSALKPSFSPVVVHGGHAYGFDGRFLSCVDLENGERRWKGGRYGSGQLMLLPDQDLLLVVSERGELALVAATPEKFTELARFAAIEGRTWNQPALVGDILWVRNGQEMAAFRLPLAEG